MSRTVSALLVLACVTLAGCAARPAAKPDPRDPFERINRVTYRFNDAIDRAVAKPVAKSYRWIAPQFVETGVSNFMDNISYPVVIVNDLLQGKLRPALSDTGRLLLNTTVGLGGLLDPASDAGLDKNDEDFGQTLGKWGVPSGPYVVLPFLGPASVRDGAGFVADQYVDPRNFIERDRVRIPIQVLRIINVRAGLLSLDDALSQAYDPYAFVRNAYLTRREYLVTDGQVAEESFEDEPLPDDGSAPPPDDAAAPPPQ